MEIQILLIFLVMFSLIVTVAGYLIYTSAEKKKREATDKEELSLFEYFKSAVDIIKEHRWLVILPLIFAVPGLLLQYGLDILVRSIIPPFPFFETTGGAGLFNFRIFIYRLCDVFSKSFIKLSYGYNGAYTGSLLFIPIMILTLPGFSIIPGKLGKFIRDENKPALRTLKIILTSAFITDLALIIMLVLFYVFNMPFLVIFAGTALFMTVLASFLIPLSLLEGFIFASIKIYIEKREFNKEEPLNVTVMIFKPLFCINILLTVLTTWYYIIILPSTIANLYPDVYIPCPHPSPIFTFISSIMTAVLVTLPFTPLYKRAGVREMLVENYDFLKKNLDSFLKITSSGFVGMFILSFISLLSRMFFPVVANLVFSLFLLTIQVIFAVILLIALLKLLYKWLEVRNEKREGGR